MKKQSLVHIHALLENVRRELYQSGNVPDGAFDEYEQFGVRHTSIQRRKDAHREAIWLLLDGIDETLHRQQEPFLHAHSDISGRTAGRRGRGSLHGRRPSRET